MNLIIEMNLIILVGNADLTRVNKTAIQNYKPQVDKEAIGLSRVQLYHRMSQACVRACVRAGWRACVRACVEG